MKLPRPKSKYKCTKCNSWTKKQPDGKHRYCPVCKTLN